MLTLLLSFSIFFKKDDQKWTYSTYKDFKDSQTLQNQKFELSKFNSCQFYQRTHPHERRTTEDAKNHGAEGTEHVKGLLHQSSWVELLPMWKKVV